MKNFYDEITNYMRDALSNQFPDMTKEEIDATVYADILSDIAANIADEYVTETVEAVSADLQIFDKELLDSDTSNREHIHTIWGEGLACLRQYSKMSFDIFAGYRAAINKRKPIYDRLQTWEVLLHINAKAMQVFAETVCLLENGYADGAIAHGRALFELWCLAEFINATSNEVAKSYIDTLESNSSSYNWAKKSGFFGDKETLGIVDIIKACHRIHKESNNDLSYTKFSKDYNFACKIIHPSASGVFGRTSYLEKNPSITLVGASDYGIYPPAIHSIQLLFNINRLFLCLIENSVSYTGLGILEKWIKEKTRPAFELIEAKFHKSAGTTDK